MRKLILFVSLSIVSVFAQAQNDLCKGLSDNAGFIMEKRQDGTAASILIESAEEVYGDQAELTIKIISLAFEEPRYSNEYDKRQAVEEFTSMVYIGCYEAF
ncbi:hypothetical protein [uncultured Psychrobacter sp.]|uniref:hypothetical protein n=1 Tax=uncultured Psychrobacter sp. TaxID=259303 RepID=UPI002633C729|nr:hypothetical protein [uncultured Psychrobacter sp.]